MVRIRPLLSRNFCRFSLVLAALCLSLSTITPAASGAEITVKLLEIQSLLRKSNFDALEQRFEDLEQAYAAGKISDALIDRGYTSFAAADPAFEALLVAWVDAKPKSHRPYIARAFFHRKLGWMFRGGRYASETSDERIRLMHDNFTIAQRSLASALRLQPNSGVAYATLINMQMAAGDQDVMNEYFRVGLKADPNSFTVRRSIFNSLLPWWGGFRQDPEIFAVGDAQNNTPRRDYPIKIPEAMLQFDQFINSEPNASPHLAPLRGLTDYAVGLILSRDGHELVAVPFYKRAMAHGDYWFFHRQAALNFSRMKRHKNSLKSYSRSLELWPDNADTLERRAWVYRTLKAPKKANKDIDAALALNPQDPDLLLLKARMLRSAEKYKEAVRVLDAATLYGALDDNVWGMRGRLYLYRLNDHKRAIPDLKRATELDPTDDKYWYNYASALFRAIDCETVPAYRTYLKVCKKYGNDCFNEGVKYAREVTQHLTDSGKC